MLVTTRNACQLLNAVAPYSVTKLKDVLLEYLCLNLEAMLENQLVVILRGTCRAHFLIPILVSLMNSIETYYLSLIK